MNPQTKHCSSFAQLIISRLDVYLKSFLSITVPLKIIFNSKIRGILSQNYNQM
jgi:hypothetical protein